MNPIINDIRLRLKQIRDEHHMTQSQFSQLLNIDRSSYSRIERGILPLNLPQIIALCKQFQISADWLLTGEEEKNAAKKVKGKIINQFISSNKEAQELETFLMTFPWFMKEVKSYLRKFYKKNKESLDEETKAFLKRFTRQKKAKGR